MTAITLGITAEIAGVTTQVGGLLTFTPSARRYGPTDVIVPSPFAVTLTQGAAAPTIEITPTTTAWVWEVFEQVPNGAPTVRYLAVPDSPATINYVDLVEVDPATLNPVPTTPPTIADELALRLVTTANLSDLTNAAAARANLGLGSAATTPTTDYATAGQGAKADTAVQPNMLGTAAYTAATAYANASQGAKADTATQPADLSAAIAAAAPSYATAAQGIKADTATQPADLSAAIAAAAPSYATAAQGAKADTATQPADLNAAIAAVGVWTAYTPTGKSNGVAFVGGLGGGTLVGRYTQIGKTVHWVARFTYGTSSPYASSGPITLSVPVAPAANQTGFGLAVGVIAGSVYSRFTRQYGGSDVMAVDGSDVAITDTLPGAMVTGNFLEMYGTYEAA